MVTTIQRWSNSLAVRIPKAFAAEVNLTEATDIDISINDGNIGISPVKREWQLYELVRKITASNKHDEHSWGRTSGKETW